MDAPNLAAPAHERALDALARINRLSLTALRVWREVRRRGVGLDRPLRVLDVACGGGDVALALKARALHAGLEVDVAGCDVSATAVEYARRRAGARALDVTFFQLDALADPIPPGYDLVCSSLFLHHLPEEDAVAFLANLSGGATSPIDAPQVTGSEKVTTAYFAADGDQQALEQVAAGFALGGAEAQTVAVTLLVFLVGLASAAGR